MPSIKVLIVDDSLFVRKALLRIFEDDPSTEVAGMARNGKEALEMLTTLNPDVVTMDIMMPVMDGIEALRIIMETKPTPVLMLSQFAHEGAELTLNALEIGAVDFIDKSLTGLMDFSALAKEIIAKVKAIAGRKPRRISQSPSPPEEFRGRNIIDAVAVGTST
ncbi:MAG: response regulator, partial [Nitrospirae bacterium]|nr:response regulator [Nitrospirota bacterium]